MAIEISEIELDNGTIGKLKITGTLSPKEAHDAAEEWCDENNCLMTAKPSFEQDGSFCISIFSDDYDEEQNT